MNRNNLVLRQKTKICQRHPADREEQITSLQRFVIKERKCHAYPLSFKKCSITNELDGTEDDILWQDDRDAPCTDSDIEGEEMYDMLTTDQMIQILEEDDSDKEF